MTQPSGILILSPTLLCMFVIPIAILQPNIDENFRIQVPLKLWALIFMGTLELWAYIRGILGSLGAYISIIRPVTLRLFQWNFEI